VCVLSPGEAHKDHVLAALAHGKHVLVEKPVGASVAEIREMAAAAGHAGRVVMPGHNYLYQPDVWRARRLIREGDLGRVCAAWVHYAIFHPEEIAAHYHGVLREVLPHHLYLILYLLGEPERIWAVHQSLHYEHLEVDDQATVILQMADGATVHLFASFAVDDPTSNPWTFMFKVLGTRGGVAYSWRDAIFQRPLGSLGLAIAPYEESYRYEIDHFVSRCILRGDAPLSTLQDAARTQRLVELAEESAASGAAMAVGSLEW
jgi:predicted dehydrogenase